MNNKKNKNIKDIFPILSIDQFDKETTIVVSKNADITIAFKIDLPEVFTLSEDSYLKMCEALNKAIKILPNGYVVHKQDWFVADEYRFDPENERFRNMDRVGIANEIHFSERPFLQQKSYLFVTMPSTSVTTRSSLNSSLLKREFVPKKVLDKSTWVHFVDTVNQFASIANNSLISLIPMQYEELVQYYEQYLSLELNQPVNSDIIPTENGKFQVGNKTTYTFSISDLQDYPQEVGTSVTYSPFSSDAHIMSLSFGSPLGIMLPFNHIYNQVIVVLDQDKLTMKLVAENKRHQSFSAVSKENEASILFKDSFLSEMKVNGRKPVAAHYNVLCWEEDKQIAESYKSAVAASLADLGFTPRQAIYDAETLYWSNIGGNISEIGNDNLATLFSEEAIAMMAFEGNYKDESVSKYGIRLLDRFGKPIMLDPFIDGMKKGIISNRNFLIVGPSGSGKSFMTNNMVYYQLQAGFHVVIVDVGNSYKRLCQQLGGRYITYEQDNPLSFNPFYIKNFNVEDGELENSIAELLISLWKADNENISKAEETAVAQMVHEYYVFLKKENDYNIFPCFDNFYDFAKNDFLKIFTSAGGREKEFDLQNFLYVLSPYYKGGTFDFLLNSRTNIDLVDLPFVVYELDNIKDHPVLFPVVTIMIMTTYVRKLFTVKGQDLIKSIIIEEAWKALSKPKFAGFLKWASKTVRKHNGALGVVTQELDDLIGNEIVKDAIVNNSDVKFLLDQKKYANRFREVQILLGLSDNHCMQVLSVNQKLDTNRPPYREMCVLMGDQAKVYGIEVSPVAYALFTTNKSEVERIDTLSKKYNDGYLGLKAFTRGE